MIDYSGIPCPVCGEKFDVLDDIVVCPECGAPYHRECYRKEGHCVYEEKHAAHEAWKPPVQENSRQEESAGAQRTKVCPRCSTKNYPDALFCDKCGLPFSSSPVSSPFGGAAPGQGFPQGTPMGGMPMVFDPLGGVSPSEEFDKGVTAGDLAKYVKNNTPYYLPVFKRIRDEGKGKFSFVAFLCSGGWLLYRKQYKTGIWVTLAVALLTIVSTCLQVFYISPLALNLAGQAGINLQQSVTLEALMASAEFRQAVAGLDGGSIFLLYLPYLLLLIRFGIMIFLGFMGNKLYYRHCINEVARIKDEVSDERERTQALQARGGVNTTLAMILLIGYIAVTYLPMVLSMFLL